MAFPHHPPLVKARLLGFSRRAKVGRRGVTIVILLVLVVLLWVAVLAPSAWRRFGERQGVGSIDHFHHQLQLLEHAGPKTVAPAYRLHTAMPGPVQRRKLPRSSRSTRHGRSWCSCGPPTTRRRPMSTATTARTTSASACSTGPSRSACPKWASSCRRSAASRRDAAAPCCCAAWVVWRSRPALIGVFPGMHLVWVFTGLAGLAALGLVGLMAYAKELEAEQAASPFPTRERTPSDDRRPGDPATAGYPGRLGRRRLRGAPGRRPLSDAPPPWPCDGRRSGSEPDYSGSAGGVAQLAERYVRNVEAEGSNPFTSTRSPGQRAKVGSPRRSHSPTCLCVSLIGHMRSKSGPYRDLIRLLFFHHMSDSNEPRRDEPMMTMSLPLGLGLQCPDRRS